MQPGHRFRHSGSEPERRRCRPVCINPPLQSRYGDGGGRLVSLVRQGRCKVTGATWIGRGRSAALAATPHEIRAECVTWSCHGQEIPALHAAEERRITVSGGKQLANTSCNQVKPNYSSSVRRTSAESLLSSYTACWPPMEKSHANFTFLSTLLKVVCWCDLW